MEYLISFMVILSGLVVYGAFVVLQDRQREKFIERKTTEWLLKGATRKAVGLGCWGALPIAQSNAMQGQGVFGAMGIVDGALVFEGQRDHRYDLQLTRDMIHGVLLSFVEIKSRNGIEEKPVLIIHAEIQKSWRTFTFVGNPLALQQMVDYICTDMELTLSPEGYGPENATLRRQDVYGEWHTEQTGEIYLAPNHLVFDWQIVTPLSAVRRIEIRKRTNPLAKDMIRLECDQQNTFGLVLHEGGDLAEALERLTNIQVEDHVGRKKKESE
jgi:hypothetical protein